MGKLTHDDFQRAIEKRIADLLSKKDPTAHVFARYLAIGEVVNVAAWAIDEQKRGTDTALLLDIILWITSIHVSSILACRGQVLTPETAQRVANVLRDRLLESVDMMKQEIETQVREVYGSGFVMRDPDSQTKH